MAGGIGSRFWPESRNNRPKQFLDFFGTGQSLLQMTVNRFRELVPMENILIVTNVLYLDMMLEQLPELKPEQILCEPARRNTAPCVAYAISHISGMVGRKLGAKSIADVDWEDPASHANIIVAPSDHLILREDKFIDTLKVGLDFISRNDNLLTLGMRPTRPETGYGYIQLESAKDKCENAVLPVKTFTEKPNLELAKVFYESGEFLWNSGIFLWNLRTIRKAFRSFQPSIADVFKKGDEVMGTPEEEAFIQQMFPTCPNISLDYGIMEKAAGVHVIYADFGWSDLGTWGSLYDLGEKDENRNVALRGTSLFYESQGNVVTLPEGHLAVIEGLHDTIVAQNGKVLLICKKQDEQSLRQIVADVEKKFGGIYS
ncbi:MAG: mannose-1-phosphate guanylyltransferase [Paludibacteraceae bacterium]|nr:mannose-1-phosphate guanylyltransferase [Paludibacteraceae bacterium]